METRHFRCTLSSAGLSHLIDKLENYSKSLTDKNAQFIEKLLDAGISVAYDRASGSTHRMQNYVTFSKEIEQTADGVVGIMLGIGETFISEWVGSDGTGFIDEVWPMHMLEFGSAGYALEDGTAFGGQGGRGTFSRAGYENDIEWHVKAVRDGEVVWKRATAIKPTQPMYNAMLEMQKQIVDIATEVFGGA